MQFKSVPREVSQPRVEIKRSVKNDFDEARELEDAREFLSFVDSERLDNSPIFER